VSQQGSESVKNRIFRRFSEAKSHDVVRMPIDSKGVKNNMQGFLGILTPQGGRSKKLSVLSCQLSVKSPVIWSVVMPYCARCVGNNVQNRDQGQDQGSVWRVEVR
jgi:hypothetical protein